MTDHHIDYFDVAQEEIDTAIKLFNAGNWVCAHVLAHAARSVLEKFIQKKSFEAMRTLLIDKLNISEKEAADILLKEYNAFKHADLSGDSVFLCEDKLRGGIFMAINDYITATRSLTTPMKDFIDQNLKGYLEK